MLPPRSRARRSCEPAPAPARGSSGAAPARRLAVSVLLARQRRPTALEQLVAPRVIERVRDLMLAADLLHRAVAAQAGQDDRDLLLRRPAPVLLPLLAQPRSPFGRAAHPEPAAGQSLRRYTPPGLPGAPTQLPVNAGPGSAAELSMGGTELEPVTPSLSRRCPDPLLLAVFGAFSPSCRRFSGSSRYRYALVCTHPRTLAVARGSTVYGSLFSLARDSHAYARARSRRRTS